MKKLSSIIRKNLMTLFILGITSCFGQNVGINATGAAPVSSAALDVDMTNKGILIPRVALTSTNVFAPVTGTATESLMVYNTNTAGSFPNNVIPGYYYWNGTSWQRIDASSNVSSVNQVTMGNLLSAGVFNLCTPKYMTGTNITLNPGKWMVYTNITVNGKQSMTSNSETYLGYTLSSSNSSIATTGFAFLQNPYVSTCIERAQLVDAESNQGVWVINVTQSTPLTLYLWTAYNTGGSCSVLNLGTQNTNYFYAVPVF